MFNSVTYKRVLEGTI